MKNMSSFEDSSNVKFYTKEEQIKYETLVRNLFDLCVSVYRSMYNLSPDLELKLALSRNLIRNSIGRASSVYSKYGFMGTVGLCVCPELLEGNGPEEFPDKDLNLMGIPATHETRLLHVILHELGHIEHNRIIHQDLEDDKSLFKEYIQTAENMYRLSFRGRISSRPKHKTVYKKFNLGELFADNFMLLNIYRCYILSKKQGLIS